MDPNPKKRRKKKKEEKKTKKNQGEAKLIGILF